MALVTGAEDELLRTIQNAFDARVTVRGNLVEIEGVPAEVESIMSVFADLTKLVRRGETPDVGHVERSIGLLRASDLSPSDLRDDVLLTWRGRAIRPKTAGQKRYVDAIRANTVTFGTGPAGTGKTYLAIAMALDALKRGLVNRIVLTRPIVEAGENLGFLPGTLVEKVDPYIRPLYDALFDMADAEYVDKLIDQGVIEIAPLAFMRGRTLSASFIILDEAQNTTREQMRMFLTRLGFGSKMVVTGDASQTDLPQGASGLIQAKEVLAGIESIAFCEFGGKDVVRHSLVAKIALAYERADEGRPR